MTTFSNSSNEPEQAALPVILLAGPTAAGKTALSLELAKRLSSEIVNADSMQVYRYMDIGTAKPTASERELIHHHLIDIADPDDPFDAARYSDLAIPVVKDLHVGGKIPLVVGGTGLYMKVLTRGICPGPPTDPDVKERLAREAETRGLAELHLRLSEIDPRAASKIHPNDRQRILRALEFFYSTGTPLSESQSLHGFAQTLFPTIKILVSREREELYGRINRRTEIMIEEGLRGEVESLLSMGYGPELKPMQSIGYAQMVRHVLGEIGLDETIYLIRRDTRRYAKRQLTWFRGDPGFRTFNADDVECIFSHILGELRQKGFAHD